MSDQDKGSEPSMYVLPKNARERLFGKGEVEAAMEISEKLETARKNLRKENFEEQILHPDYKPCGDKLAWQCEGNPDLLIDGKEVELDRIRIIPGFRMVHQDDDRAIFKVWGYWWTMVDGAESLAKAIGEHPNSKPDGDDEDGDDFSYGSILKRMTGLGSFVEVNPKHVWIDEADLEKVETEKEDSNE